MPKLSNDLLRERSMKDFLTKMGIDITGIDVASIEGLFNFSFIDNIQAEQFAKKLNDIIQVEGENKTIKTLSLIEIVEREIAEATSEDSAKTDTHRAACKALLDIIKLSGTPLTFSQDLGLLEVTLPAPAYAAMLNLLKYPHLTVSPDGKVTFNIKEYLKNISENVVKIEGFNSHQSSLVFLNASALESKKMFYASKSLADGSLEVTPYFFVPKAVTPPIYHFVLDVSTSMRTSLEDLKKSVNILAQQLFSFQPNAELTITTFSCGIHLIGIYKAEQLEKLYCEVNALHVRGDTPLYEVTADFINRITSATSQNNVLLFTDGQDSGTSKPGSESVITTKLASLGLEPSLTKTRNKFYIFSYGVSQTPLMHRVAATFMSDIVDTNSADFITVQKDPELMKTWAAARDLFSVRLLVSDKVGTQSTSEYQRSLDMSGQLANLDTRVCQPGDQIKITITDGSGKEVIQSSLSLSQPQPAAAQRLSPASSQSGAVVASDASTIARVGLMPAPVVAKEQTSSAANTQSWGDWFRSWGAKR